jgi:predicted Rossmann fold nucleotide-binding protein DprA/Smf involved in DNA uptake
MKAIKIVSGGQTGADRAALDWALAHGVKLLEEVRSRIPWRAWE